MKQPRRTGAGRGRFNESTTCLQDTKNRTYPGDVSAALYGPIRRDVTGEPIEAADPSREQWRRIWRNLVRGCSDSQQSAFLDVADELRGRNGR
jgi:hypothetical protein